MLPRSPASVIEHIRDFVIAERERKELKGVKKMARDRARQAKLHNKKLRDCRAHLHTRHKRRLESTLFITEGDSASGSITKVRDVETQAVFSLRGKPLNCHGLKRDTVYKNEELFGMMMALGIEDDIENLRYNRVVIATDADATVIMVSSMSGKDKIVECAKAGAKHYILKPFEEEKIIEVLEKVVFAEG